MNEAIDNEEDMYRNRLMLERACYGFGSSSPPSQKNENAITEFLGEGLRAVEAYCPPWYLSASRLVG